MDLLTIVVQPTWREFLIDLIHSNQMDPWDIDLSKVADIYLSRVRELQSLDLRVPANVILASALLLHFKADALTFDEPQEETVEEIAPLIDEEIPPLVFRTNLPRQRRVTLQELLNAVDEVMKKGSRQAVLPSVAPMPLNIVLPKETLHERIIKIYEKALAIKDAENVLLFSALFEGEVKNAEQVTLHLLPVLHLVQEQRMIAWQDQLYGEIFIKILEHDAPATSAVPAEIGKNAQEEMLAG